MTLVPPYNRTAGLATRWVSDDSAPPRGAGWRSAAGRDRDGIQRRSMMKEVVIHVRGGIAEIVFKDRGIQVTIVDWDNDEPTTEVAGQDPIGEYALVEQDLLPIEEDQS